MVTHSENGFGYISIVVSVENGEYNQFIYVKMVHVVLSIDSVYIHACVLYYKIIQEKY